jgi:hypothetical protein
MKAPTVPHTIEFTPSRQRVTVDFGRLSDAIIEFLELYADEPLVGPDFKSLIREGDDETRFAQLLGATSCSDSSTDTVHATNSPGAKETSAKSPSKQRIWWWRNPDTRPLAMLGPAP